jgi:hypothetical protein
MVDVLTPRIVQHGNDTHANQRVFVVERRKLRFIIANQASHRDPPCGQTCPQNVMAISLGMS